MWSIFRFDVMFNLIVFTFEVLQDRRLFNYIVGKFLPLHISVSIDIDLFEEICEVSNEPSLSVGQVDLPELKVSLSDINELRQG